MAEIVGLVIGPLGLSITLFNTALDAYRVLVTASNLGKDAEVYQAQLAIEEARLKRWGEALGLCGENPTSSTRLSADSSLSRSIMASLSSIKGILMNMDELKRLYGLDARGESTDGGVLLTELAATKILDSEALLKDYSRHKEDAEKVQKRLSIMKKLRWVIKDKEKFQDLILTLRGFNDGLYSLLPPVEADILADAIFARLLKSTNLGKIMVIKSAAQISNPELASLAQLRFDASTILMGAASRPDMTKSAELLTITSGAENLLATQALGLYRPNGNDSEESIPVFVEWKFTESSLTGHVKRALDVNTNDLAFFLQRDRIPTGLRSLGCLGLVKPPAETAEYVKCGLVFHLPEQASTSRLPISLHDLLNSTDEDEPPNFELDLGDKFRLARILAQSLYELHVASWLHKAICSSNVLFFRPLADDAIRLSHAYLGGYEFTRPGGLKDPTKPAGDVAQNVHAHPRYRKGGVKYHPLFDIYSLGIVLLEVGLWLRSDTTLSAQRSPEHIQRVLIESCERQLGPSMGVEYRNATRACLEGDFGIDGLNFVDVAEASLQGLTQEERERREEAYAQVNAELADAFYDRVVRPLKRLFA